MAYSQLESRVDQVHRLKTDGLLVADIDRELVLAEARGAQEALSKEYLTMQETCAFARVCRKTVYNWMRQQRIRFTKTPGGEILIARSSFALPTEIKP